MISYLTNRSPTTPIKTHPFVISGHLAQRSPCRSFRHVILMVPDHPRSSKLQHGSLCLSSRSILNTISFLPPCP
jgi:hypothetical protein